MSNFTLTHEINCTAEQFVKMFFDNAYNDALYKQALGCPGFALTIKSTSATQIVGSFSGKLVKGLSLPVIKAVGASEIQYSESGTFDTQAMLWSATLNTSYLPDRFSGSCKVSLVAVGSNKVSRVVKYSVVNSIFGIGGLIDSLFEAQLRADADASAAQMNQWIAAGNI